MSEHLSKAIRRGAVSIFARSLFERPCRDVECFQAERTPDELARDLGITTNTVYARKFKIRAKLAGIVATMTRAGQTRQLVRS